MVMVAAKTYGEMLDLFTELKARERKSRLGELDRRFDERLAVLQQSGARSRLDAMLTARGKLASDKRPVAGESF
jgi:hypothetical protein